MRKILLLVALTATLHLCQGIKTVYDELLYTKQLWQEYKLDFPYSVFKEDDEVTTRAKDSLAGLFLEDSLSGPLSNLQELIEQDVRRGEFQPNSFDVSLIEDSTPLPGAASVAQCKTCLALATAMWQGLVEWSHRYLGTVSAHDLIPYGESLCEYEVPEVVLKDWVVLSARVHGNGSPEHPPQQFYMLSVRHRQHARVREIQVVRAACKALLSDNHANALNEERELSTDDVFRMEPSPLLKIIAAKQKEYLEALKEKGAFPLEKAESNSYPNKNDEIVVGDDNIIPALDDDLEEDNEEDSRPSAPSPKVQRKCFNKHPQCEYWAERGECKANPGYMVGTELTGWCRAACFVCPHPQPVAPGGVGSPTAIADLEQVSSDLLDTVQTTGCTKSTPCRGIDENAAAKSRLATAAGVDPERTAALLKVELISGPIEAESFGNAVGAPGADGSGTGTANGKAVHNVHANLLEDSMVVTALSIEKAVIPKTKESIDEISKKTLETSPKSGVEAALWNELHGQCLYMTTGWWSYEVCYLHSIDQFHLPGGQNEPQWIISLGKYASSDWEIRNITVHKHKTGLYPVGSVVPYVSQQLEQGNLCELTGEDGVNSLEKIDGGADEEEDSGSSKTSKDTEKGTQKEEKATTTSTSQKLNANLNIGDSVFRTTVVRFMCSPDANRHIAVVEPEQCRYIVDVYVPALCRIDVMAPVLPKVPETVEVPEVDDDDDDSTNSEIDVDDDPYMDPDELEEIELKRKVKKKKSSKKVASKDEL